MTSLVKDHLAGGRTPLVVVLNTTFRCNFQCGYCYGQYFSRTDKDFTTEELFELIDGLGRLGTRSITLGGGEPLMRKDIGAVIGNIKSKGIECGMNTNGSLIPKRIDELKAIDMLTVSIDGPRELNDANRGEGSFDAAMAGIDAAIENGIKIHTTCVITKHNVDAVDWVVDLAKAKGIQTEFNLLFHQSTDRKESDTFMAENEALRGAVKRIVELKKQGAPILFSDSVYRYVSEWPDFSKRVFIGKEPDFKYVSCYAGRFMMFIDADGRVYPCVQLIDTFKALDFREVGIEKAWDNCAGHACKACYFPCFTEFNYILDLNPKIIAKQVLSTIKGH
jgi:MoaA/NifB/PqqE/SkfB family radical SAM enzyme